MWNNYTVELQSPGRIDDHLAEARANALEAEARPPRASTVALITRRASAAVVLRASRLRRSAAERAAALRLAATTRVRTTRHQLVRAAGRLRHLHLHLHRPAFGHRA